MSKNRAVLEPDTSVGKYKIIKRVGKGGFGDVYLVKDHNNLQYALKTEYLTAEKKAMENELKIYKILKNCRYVPVIYKSGTNEFCRYFVMDLFGPSISSCRSKLNSRKFILRHTLFLAQKTLMAIKTIHKKGIIHRDIKASNFLIKPYAKNPLYLLDYGVSRNIIDPKTKKMLPNVGGKFVGTTKYASPYAHIKQQLSYRDDLYSWFYMVSEFANKRLPWSKVKEKDQLYDLKVGADPSSLRGSLPYQFTEIYKLIQQYEYEDVPDYKAIYQMIEDAKAYHSIYFSGKEWSEIWSLNQEAVSLIEPDPHSKKYAEYSDEYFTDEHNCCNLI